MKTKILLTVLAAAGLAWPASTVQAQSSPTATAPPAVSSATAPPLNYGVSEVLRLSQAGVSNDVILAYIRNSGLGFGMNADAIIYLQGQGVATAVLNAMVSQPVPVAASAPVPAYVPSTTAAVPTVDDSQYSDYYQPGYDYSGYGYYPYYSYPIGVSWWGGGYWGGGRDWRGGAGGWHGSSGWHGAASAGVSHVNNGGGGHGGGGFGGGGHGGHR